MERDADAWTAPRRGVCLVTGAAGFIGFHLARRLIADGYRVVGIDSLTPYYDVALKRERLKLLSDRDFFFVEGDIQDRALLDQVFVAHEPEYVINLAAQAGVRYSLEHPDAYIASNVNGFLQILEACRRHPVRHLVYASSSSIYGQSDDVPYAETQQTDQPISLYAATKKSNELFAHAYSHLFGIRATGLRFFTVYGPFGRPDMAYFSFLDKHFRGEPINIYNSATAEGDLWRDFTYVDDIIEGVSRVLVNLPRGAVPHEVYNIGNSFPVRLMEFIGTLERCLSRSLDREIEFEKRFVDRKPGDVDQTFASTEKLRNAVGFAPFTPLEVGLQRFVDWYVSYYGRS